MTSRTLFIAFPAFVLWLVYCGECANTGLPLVRKSQLSEIKTIGIVAPFFDNFHLTAGGIREYDDSLSRASRSLLIESIGKTLVQRGFKVNNLALDTSCIYQLTQIRRFYLVVNQQIQYYVYGPDPLPKAWVTFPYSLPPIDSLLSNLKVDAILVLCGFDDLSTNRRKRLRAGAVAGAIAGAVLSTIVLGTTVVSALPPEDIIYANCALINKDGSFAWYNTHQRTGKFDIHEPKDLERYVAGLLDRLKK